MSHDVAHLWDAAHACLPVSAAVSCHLMTDLLLRVQAEKIPLSRSVARQFCSSCGTILSAMSANIRVRRGKGVALAWDEGARADRSIKKLVISCAACGCAFGAAGASATHMRDSKKSFREAKASLIARSAGMPSASPAIVTKQIASASPASSSKALSASPASSKALDSSIKSSPAFPKKKLSRQEQLKRLLKTPTPTKPESPAYSLSDFLTKLN